jgi:hypothetical protein
MTAARRVERLRSGTSLPTIVVGAGLGLLVTLLLGNALLADGDRVPEDAIGRVGLVVALLALAFGWLARAAPAHRVRPSRTVLDLAGGALGVLAVATYGGLGNDLVPYHSWEHYHYYLGAKYFGELSYRRLYACAAVAEAERVGRDEMEGRRMRDLATDQVVTVDAAIAAPEACTRHFTPARWRAFGDDVMFFRGVLGPMWDRMQQDHGFNPPPTWVLAGGALARLGPASTVMQRALARIDRVLLGMMLGTIAWAFGSHVLLVALVAWGCQVPGQGSWTAGGFLRQDWLLLVVAAVCLARRGFPAAAGVAIASAAALRLFPALLLVLPLVVIVRRRWRSGRVGRFDRRFVAGVVAGGAAWLAVSTAAFGAESWLAFRDHITLHRLTPLANHVGLRSIFAQSWEGRWIEVMQPGTVDPFHEWKRLRRETFTARETSYRVVTGALLALGVVAGWRIRRLWVALAASAGLVPVLVDVSSYYCALFVALGLLAAATRRHEWLALGAVVASRAVDALPIAAGNPDIRYTVAQSLVFVGWGALALVLLVWTPRRRLVPAERRSGGRGARRRAAR